MDVIKILGWDGERISETVTGRYSARVNYRWNGSDGSIVDIIFEKRCESELCEAISTADSITGLHIGE
jgi:hypothetical protein